MQAIILAGGFGTRLQAVVKDLPKPMADINGAPFLAYLISYLKNNDVTDVVLSVGYLKEKIINYFGDFFSGIKIHYAVEDTPLGTGGAIINSLKYCDENQPVIILNGDTFLKVDYRELLKFHLNQKADFTMVLRHMEDCSRYGKVIFDEQKIISDFQEKTPGSGYINCGIYVLNSKILSKYNLATKFSFEQDFLNKFVNQIKPHAFVVDGYFIDIGIPEDYEKAKLELPKI